MQGISRSEPQPPALSVSSSIPRKL